MRKKLVSNSACFYKLVFLAALVGVCRMTYGDGERRYHAIVKNVLDVTHVVIDGMRSDGRMLDTDYLLLLDGIAIPEKGSSEEAALRKILEKTLLNKRVNVLEYMNVGSRGASLFVTDDQHRRVPEDNVNLMLVREGFARFSGKDNCFVVNPRAMEEAQRLAQSERKGIWADFEPPPDPPPAVTNALADPPPPSPEPPTNVVANIEPPENKPAGNKAPPWTLYLAILALAAIGGAIMWRKAKRK